GDQRRARTGTSHGAQASRIGAGCALLPTFGRLCCFGVRQLPAFGGRPVGGAECAGGAGAFAMRLLLRWVVACVVFAVVVSGVTIYSTAKFDARSEERRVGKERRSRGWPGRTAKKKAGSARREGAEAMAR